MTDFPESIATFLKHKGFQTEPCYMQGSLLLCVRKDGLEHIILPYPVMAGTAEEAQAQNDAFEAVIGQCAIRPLIISEDLWRRQPQMMQARLLAHLEDFTQIYARNCEIRRIEKPEAAGFLSRTHSYGDAACRYRYGMFLKRHTGHNAAEIAEGRKSVEAGTLIAVATFSNARKWDKGGKIIRSYEWTRYASLPGLRISGAMGRMLKTFINEVQPDDIMTYADLEWSEGKVYETLGFVLEGHKDPVTFTVDRQWKRTPVSRCPQYEDCMFLQNFGSLKYRLKLTEY